MPIREIVVLDVTESCPFGVSTHEGSSCNFDSQQDWDIDCTTCKLPVMTYYDALQKGAYAIAKKRFGKHADAIQMSNAYGWTECEDYAQAVIDSLLENK